MADGTTETAQAAAAVAVEVAAKEQARETTAEAVAEVVEAAGERVAEAERSAEAIAAAAMETERGTQIDGLKRDFAAWQTSADGKLTAMETRQTELHQQVTTLQAQLTDFIALAASQSTIPVPTPPAVITEATGEASIAAIVDPALAAASDITKTAASERSAADAQGVAIVAPVRRNRWI